MSMFRGVKHLFSGKKRASSTDVLAATSSSHIKSKNADSKLLQQLEETTAASQAAQQQLKANIEEVAEATPPTENATTAGVQHAGRALTEGVQSIIQASTQEQEESYLAAVRVIRHSIGGYDDKGLSPENLLQFVAEAFNIPHSEQAKYNERAEEYDPDTVPILRVTIEHARNLAQKDPTGKSDPYVILRLFHIDERTVHKTEDRHAEEHQSQSTSIINDDLDPNWHESFDFDVIQAETKMLVLDVWDHDTPDSFRERFKSDKKFSLKHFHPGRFIKDKISRLAKGELDDFLGTIELPIVAMPAGGSTHTIPLQKRSERSEVSGTLTFSVSWDSKQQDGSLHAPFMYVQQHYHLTLKLIHHDGKEFEGDQSRAFHGRLSPKSEHILLQHRLLVGLSDVQVAMVRVIAFSEYMVKQGLEFTCMTLHLKKAHKLLLETDVSVLSPELLENYAKAVDNAITVGITLLQSLFIEFVASDDGHNALKSVVSMIRTGFFSPVWQKHGDNASRRCDVEVKAALETHVSKHLEILRALSQTTKRYHGSRIMETTTFINKIVQFMADGHNFFRAPLFQLGVDVLEIIVAHADPILAETIKKRTEAWKPSKDTEIDDAGSFARVFQMYTSAQAVLTNVFPLLQSEEMRAQLELNHIHDWFVNSIMDWMSLLRIDGKGWVDRAIETDDLQPVTDTALHSCSVVDIFTLLGRVWEFWLSLNFPKDHSMYESLLTILATTLCSIVYEYIEDVITLTRSKKFYDDEGQFDLSLPLCTSLSDVQQVIYKLQEMQDEMGVAELQEQAFQKQRAEGVAEDELTAPTISKFFQETVTNCQLKANSLVQEAADHMQVDMIRKLVTAVFEQGGMKADDISSDEIAAFSSDVLDYVDASMEFLSNHVYTDTLQQFFGVLWGVVARAFVVIISPPATDSVTLDELTPARLKLLESVLKFLKAFFHQDGAGLAMEKLDCADYQRAVELLEFASRTSDFLIDQFYREEALAQAHHVPRKHRGTLTVLYNIQRQHGEEVLSINILHANNLPVMDVGGACDAYVKLDVRPKARVEPEKQRTKAINKTLNPKWNASFTFKTQSSFHRRALCMRVMDHDILAVDGAFSTDCYCSVRSYGVCVSLTRVVLVVHVHCCFLSCCQACLSFVVILHLCFVTACQLADVRAAHQCSLISNPCINIVQRL
eukprot:m.279403 g.279403  ORF g.279403 m.279403 type:complete len:1176 (+) comp15743_c0_seq1:442-3969(+)